MLTRFWYDDNGNRIREQQGAEEVLYDWDTHDQLTRVRYADGTSQSFVYSDDGLRKRVVERDGRVLNYVWDGSNLLSIVDAATGALQARFTHADEGSGGLLSQRTSDGSRFYGFDQSSNTRLLSNSGGGVSDRYSYTAYGAPRQVLGSSPNPHRFGGQVGYFQEEDGRAYVQQRHLDTKAGRWMSTDPIGFEGGDWNLYGYVGNNPVGFVDWTGEYKYTARYPPPPTLGQRVLRGVVRSGRVVGRVGMVILQTPLAVGAVVMGVAINATAKPAGRGSEIKRGPKPLPRMRRTCANLGMNAGIPGGEFAKSNLVVAFRNCQEAASAIANSTMPLNLRQQGFKNCTARNGVPSTSAGGCRNQALHWDICCRKGKGNNGKKLWSLQCCPFCIDTPEGVPLHGCVCYASGDWGERRAPDQEAKCLNAFA